MRILKVLVVVLALLSPTLAQSAEKLEFKARVGFAEADEKIIAQKIIDEDRKIILIGKKTIQIWDILNAKLIETRPHEILKLNESKTVVEISPNGKKAIALDAFTWRIFRKEKKVSASIYDLQTGKLLTVLERPDESIRYARWSEDGKTLITYSGLSNDKRTEIGFWNGADFEFRFSILAQGRISIPYLSKDNERFFLSTQDTVKFYGIYEYVNDTVVWNTKTGKAEQRFKFDRRENPFVFSFSQSLSQDEKYFASSAEEKIAVWQVGGNNLPKYEIDVKKPWRALKGFSDDSRFLIVYQNKTLEFYNAETGKLENSLPNIKLYEDVKLLADGKTLILKNCDRADAYNLQTRQKLYEIKLVCKEQFDIAGSFPYDYDVFRFHPNRPLLLTYSDKTVRVWNTENGALVQTIVDPNRAEKKRKDNNKDDGLSWGADWIGNGEYLFAYGADGKTILLWEIKK